MDTLPDIDLDVPLEDFFLIYNVVKDVVETGEADAEEASKAVRRMDEIVELRDKIAAMVMKRHKALIRMRRMK